MNQGAPPNPRYLQSTFTEWLPLPDADSTSAPQTSGPDSGRGEQEQLLDSHCDDRPSSSARHGQPHAAADGVGP